MIDTPLHVWEYRSIKHYLLPIIPHELKTQIQRSEIILLSTVAIGIFSSDTRT